MKGEVQQVFIYIMVILVVGAVLLFGTKAIGDVIKKGCEVDKVSFQTALKNKIESSSDYGSIVDGDEGIINAPCGYERLCILDAEAIKDTVASGFNTPNLAAESDSNLMVSEVVAGTGNNVFLIKGKEIIPLFALDTIRINDIQNNKYLCINATGGRFYLRLEGVGKGTVSISEGS